MNDRTNPLEHRPADISDMDIDTLTPGLPACGHTHTQTNPDGHIVWTCDRTAPHPRHATRIGDTDYLHPLTAGAPA